MRLKTAQGGKGVACLHEGWSDPEPDFTWAIGPTSTLRLPVAKLKRTCILRLRCWPFKHPGTLDSQRVIITAAGQELAQYRLTVGRSLVTVLPRALVAGVKSLDIVLHHPDNARPKDFAGATSGDDRLLAVAYQDIELEELDADTERLADEIRDRMDADSPFVSAEPLISQKINLDPTTAALSRLQSIGDDCELGFVQRHWTLEPLGIFRFAGIAIDKITRGVSIGLSDFGIPENLEILEQPGDAAHDYVGYETQYDVRYHTTRYPAELPKDALHTSETQRLRYLSRKFMGDLKRGQHLFVIKRKEPLYPEEIARLLIEVRRQGPTSLLWVCEADARHPAGSAEWLLPGLLRAFITRIDVAPMKQIDMEGWAEMAHNAVKVWLALPPSMPDE
jgi:hypothetical protein